ncbi:MAG: T9SS type A sorting domain-containing protein [Bacteroidota bacterium]|jgi:hypothetical protein
MKKTLLSLSAILLTTGLMAQSVIYSSGPVFDLAGGGAGGANASTLHDGFTTYGAGHALSTGYRVAEDIIVPAGETWSIDSIAFFAYQTNSGNTSTITEVNVRIWSGTPGGASTIVFGDSTTNLMLTTDWSGTYRTGDFTSTTCAPATCVARPVMRNVAFIGTTLSAGTYWIDWQTGGSTTSGPWAPPVNLGAGNTTTGNAKQYINDPASPSYTTWVDLTDGGTLTPQGLPIEVVGSVVTGVQEVNAAGNISVFPNPISNKATVSISGTTSERFEFVVFDMIGNVVRSYDDLGAGSFSFDRSGLQNGVYFYEVRGTDNSIRTGKMVLN